jgi:uncharacterized alpha-E superfamily protein
MLARIAENIYWLGRYVERVDDMLRLLEVQEETGGEAGAQPWRMLIDVCGIHAPHAHSRNEVVNTLLVEDASHSIRTAVRNARENARIVRDRLTLEVWTAVNGFYLGLERRAQRTDLSLPDSLYEWIRERCDLIWGTIDNTLIRDDGWAWLNVGRYMERTSMTARTLIVMVPRLFDLDESSMHRWLTLLRFVSGSHAFRRVSSGIVRSPDVVSFVLRSDVFPRSLTYSAREAHRALFSAGHEATRAARRLQRLRADLDFRHAAEVCARPEQILRGVLSDLDMVHQDLQEEIFGLEPVLMATEFNSAL